MTGPTITGRSAVLSNDGRYRYSLTREFTPHDETGQVDRGLCAFMLCNPSTATAEFDDPTVRKCIGFAWRWGFSSILMVNRAAYRATKPGDLLAAHGAGIDIVGPANTSHVIAAALRASLFVAAWGAAWPVELDDVATRAPNPLDLPQRLVNPDSTGTWCLGRTASGAPRHPLMLAYSTELEEYAA